MYHELEEREIAQKKSCLAHSDELKKLSFEITEKEKHISQHKAED